MRVYRLTSIAPLALALAAATLAATLVATTAQAQPQDRDQQRCIYALNKAGTGVVRTQGKIVSGCIKNALKGRETDPQGCLTKDPRGKLSKAQEKVTAARARKCSTEPDFAAAAEQAINDAATQGLLALVADLFGPDLNTGIDVNDAATGRCQAGVYKGLDKLLQAELKAFVKCKKVELKQGLDSAELLAATCLGAVRTDPRGTLVRLFGKLTGTLAKNCAAAEQATNFAGSCGEAEQLSLCLATLADCRTCTMFNAMDALPHDCDSFDDGQANASCSAVGR